MNRPTVLLFGGKSCQNCKALVDILKIRGVPVKYMDCDKNPELIEEYKIQARPTTIIIKQVHNTKEHRRWTGISNNIIKEICRAYFG